jgi:hypothetical protein
MPLFRLVTPVSTEPVEPPKNRMPAPEKFLIVRTAPPRAANTTLLTRLPMVRPFEPAAVPCPSNDRPSFTATEAARATVRPARGAIAPTAPANEMPPPAVSDRLRRPSTVPPKTRSPPA